MRTSSAERPPPDPLFIAKFSPNLQLSRPKIVLQCWNLQFLLTRYLANSSELCASDSDQSNLVYDFPYLAWKCCRRELCPSSQALGSSWHMLVPIHMQQIVTAMNARAIRPPYGSQLSMVLFF